MGILEMLLWLLGGLGAIILLCVCTLWLEKNFPGEEYDERQKIARGNAYRLSFGVGIIWTFAYILYITFWGNRDIMLVVLWFGFFAQTMTFHIYCLLTHAALPMSQKPMTTIIGYGVLTAVYVFQTVIAIDIDARWPEKPQANTWMKLSLAVWFGVLTSMHLIQYLRDKKE